MCIGHSMTLYWAVTTGVGILMNAVMNGLESELGRLEGVKTCKLSMQTCILDDDLCLLCGE